MHNDTHYECSKYLISILQRYPSLCCGGFERQTNTFSRPLLGTERGSEVFQGVGVMRDGNYELVVKN